MPSAVVSGRDTFAGFDERILSRSAREAALQRFATLRSGRDRPNRYWRVDLEAIDVNEVAPQASRGQVAIDAPAAHGLITCDLRTAARDHRALLDRAMGVALPERKFASLARAFADLGAFVYVSADTCPDGPITVHYRAASDAPLFFYTVVLLERGASATIIERTDAPSGSFVCGASEIVTEENAEVTYAVLQQLPPDARGLFARAARPGRDGRATLAIAELGAGLAVTDVDVRLEAPGTQAQITAAFFPTGTQHVDIVSTVDHDSGDSISRTLVKCAAAGTGQARYLGNIRIARHAQHSDASLRDDALLLSHTAHIDSVPALEIAANDVKAFHGATIGAIDEEQVFYMQSRGFTRAEAERMIAAGFFDPAINQFPTERLRTDVRDGLTAQLAAMQA